MTMTHLQARGLSRREIQGFAGGLAQKFAVSAEHYAWLAYSHRLADVHIDILTLHIEPVVFAIDRNIHLVQLCKDTLLRNISLLRPPASIIAADIWVCFGIDLYIDRGICGKIGTSTFFVTLTDDRGKDWTGLHTENTLLCCK